MSNAEKGVAFSAEGFLYVIDIYIYTLIDILFYMYIIAFLVQNEKYVYMISPAGTPSTTSPSGWKMPDSTPTATWSSCSLATRGNFLFFYCQI